ncbi:MAG: hypothetical protein IKO57_12145 [Treponema sp.]|nr:hypothetical protein [Treponema sp.]
MKKIVSAMALGALVLGAASADLKIGINYRNGMNIYSGTFNQDGTTTKNFLNQLGYNSGKDTVKLTATGDIFDFLLQVQPTVSSDALAANALAVGAKYGVGDGTLHGQAGWWCDGVANGNIRITTDASNFEGLDWEGNKPGSIFKERPNTFVINMADFGLDKACVTAMADYTLPTDAATIKFLGSIITDYGTKKGPNDSVNAGAWAWGVNVNAKLPGLVEIEALAKGCPKWNGLTNDDGEYAGATAFALYAMPLMVQNLKLAVGGSLGMIDGLSDIAVDLRANYKVNDSLSLTTYNNISVVKKLNGTSASEDYGQATFGRSYFGSSNSDKGSAEKGNTGLWNMLGIAYKVNSTVTIRGSIEHQRMLARNESAKDKKDDTDLGSTLRFTPAVELTATKGASILAGVTCAMQGIGQGESDAGVKPYGENIDWYWSIPVLFRVKM